MLQNIGNGHRTYREQRLRCKTLTHLSATDRFAVKLKQREVGCLASEIWRRHLVLAGPSPAIGVPASAGSNLIGKMMLELPAANKDASAEGIRKRILLSYSPNRKIFLGRACSSLDARTYQKQSRVASLVHVLVGIAWQAVLLDRMYNPHAIWLAQVVTGGILWRTWQPKASSEMICGNWPLENEKYVSLSKHTWKCAGPFRRTTWNLCGAHSSHFFIGIVLCCRCRAQLSFVCAR